MLEWTEYSVSMECFFEDDEDTFEIVSEGGGWRCVSNNGKNGQNGCEYFRATWEWEKGLTETRKIMLYISLLWTENFENVFNISRVREQTNPKNFTIHPIPNYSEEGVEGVSFFHRR